MCLARCSLRVKLNWQGGKSVQKNRWPFFFLVGRFESPSTLSSSEISRSSSSIMSTSCASSDFVCLCDDSRTASLRGGSVEGTAVSLPGSCDGVNGAVGSGRWPTMPLKLSRVGVRDEASSVVSAPCEVGWAMWMLLGRGVVGVSVAMPVPAAESVAGSEALTALKPDIAPECDGLCSLSSRPYAPQDTSRSVARLTKEGDGRAIRQRV